MSQQKLDGAQVRAGFQHVGREAVAQRVRANPFADAGAQSGLMAGVPHCFIGDRLLYCAMPRRLGNR